ncbi:MAG: hemerythrin domain-containing protein [Alphaproteobacteria bacterium]|nr:MAG: hemerythrin domain-containing protein [Alphaproteobacteria bacterium]
MYSWGALLGGRSMTATVAPDPLIKQPPDPEHFLRPLALMRLEHKRQRQVWDRLEALAEELSTDPAFNEAAAILAILTEELPRHAEDEEADLFPLLERRCLPDDNIGDIVAQLRSEHELDEDLSNFIVSDLEVLAKGAKLANPVRLLFNARAFAEAQRRHIAWENTVLLPLARRRLTEADLKELGRNMAARRGIVYPG